LPKSKTHIQMLFHRLDLDRVAFNPAHANEVEQAIHRYNWLTHYLRYSYLLTRIKKIYSYAQEFIFARSFVERLLKQLT